MTDYESMKATKTTKKYRYQKDAEKNASKKRTYSYERDASKPRRKKYSYEKDLERAAKKGLSKAGIGLIILLALVLAVGAVAGFFGIKYIFKNDTFNMVAYANGEIDVVIGDDGADETYTELGVKCISFGNDCTSECTVTYYYREDLSTSQIQVDKVDETQEGMYYAVYTTTATRYKKTTLIRNITVMGVED